MTDVYFGVLGPMLVRDDEQVPITISAGLHCGILAILLVNANRIVGRDELAEHLWDGRPPASASTTTTVHIARLRQALGPVVGARIRTRAPGYLIEVSPDECDLLSLRRIEREAAAAQERGAWSEVSDLADEALRLWRGEPFQDVPVTSVHRDESPALDAARVRLAQLSATADLRLGRSDAGIETLTRLVAEHPLREPLYEQLMAALTSQGRRAEALEVYRRARRVLRDELGLDPSPALEELHRTLVAAPARVDAVSRARPRPRLPIPRHLPPAPRFFTGRSDVLDAMAQAARSPGATVLSVVGTGGIGKTATVLTWSHRMVEQFPDGQLFVNLRGFDPEANPVAPTEVLAGFLQALGVPAQQIPAKPADRAAYFRTLLADLRVLVVLDNAADAAQVRDLLPGGPGCLTVVTSRDRLAGLVIDGAQPFRLAPLNEAESLDLLAARLGKARTEPGRASFGRLVAVCAGLPLALAVIAARMALEPELSATRLADRLQSERDRLRELGGADTATDVRAVFSWSWRQLSPPAAAFFVRLGLHPGPTISPEAAACLADVALPTGEAALRELVECHLLTPLEGDRYQVHDLLRLYALELACTQLGPVAIQCIRVRMLDHYIVASLAADRATTPQRRPAPAAFVTHLGCGAPGFEGPADAGRWLESERPVLLALSLLAGTEGFDQQSWQLPWALSIFLDRRGDWGVLLALLTQAAAATQRLGEPACRALILCDTSTTYSRMGEHASALACLDEAQTPLEQIGDHMGLSRLERLRAHIYEGLGDNVSALACSNRSLRLARRHGDALAQGLALTAVSWHHAQLGHYQEALDLAREGLDLHERAGFATGQADVLDTMALAHFHLGRPQEALAHYQRALTYYVAQGERYFQARVLARIGGIHELLGDRESTHDARKAAWAIVDELDIAESDALRSMLPPLAVSEPAPAASHQRSGRGEVDPTEQRRHAPDQPDQPNQLLVKPVQ